jgi:hypothetical protein
MRASTRLGLETLPADAMPGSADAAREGLGLVRTIKARNTAATANKVGKVNLQAILFMIYLLMMLETLQLMVSCELLNSIRLVR